MSTNKGLLKHSRCILLMAAFTLKQRSIETETVMPKVLNYLAFHRKNLLTLGLGPPNINIWHFAIFVFISLSPRPLHHLLYFLPTNFFLNHLKWSVDLVTLCLNISACVLRTSLLFSINHIIMITPRAFNITILLTNIQISPNWPENVLHSLSTLRSVCN